MYTLTYSQGTFWRPHFSNRLCTLKVTPSLLHDEKSSWRFFYSMPKFHMLDVRLFRFKKRNMYNVSCPHHWYYCQFCPSLSGKQSLPHTSKVQVSKCPNVSNVPKCPSAARVLQCAFVHLQSSFLRAFAVQQRVCHKIVKSLVHQIFDKVF